MKVSQMYPDKWLKAKHLGGQTRGVTVETSTDEELFNTREKRMEWKIVLRFYGKNLPLVLNKTQSLAVAKITGEDDSAKWIGYQMNLTPACTSNGEDTIIISGPQRNDARSKAAPPPVTPPAETPPAQ